MNTLRTLRLVLPMALAMAVLAARPAAAVEVFTETFNGGFDNSWNTLGDPGTFLTNGLGEQVLALSSASDGGGDEDGVFRVIGSGAFEAVVEISNPSFSSSLSSVQMGITDNGGDDKVFVGARDNGGGFQLLFLYNLNGNPVPTIAGFANVAAVDQITFKLVHQPDTVNGGGIFEALYDLNESGTFVSLGTINGTIYTSDATAARNFGISTLTYGVSSYAEVDFAQVVPEPGTLWLGSLGAALLGLHRLRRRARGNCNAA